MNEYAMPSPSGSTEEKRCGESPIVNPFDSEIAVRHSNYIGTRDGRPVCLTDPARQCDLFDASMAGAFRGFIQAPQFSCVGARSAVARENYRVGIYDRLGTPEATAGLARDLFTFAREKETFGAGDFSTFATLFRQPASSSEADFETLLWSQLRSLNDLDAPLFDWDASVSSDPESPHFSFSFAGTAFFVIGLHPHSSRQARRFPFEGLVFNPHAQFVALKEAGGWDRFQKIIRGRERALQGSLNPNLADYGTATEARQYSGRQVEPDWHPPFVPASTGSISDMRTSAGRCPFNHGHGASSNI